ncbi:MAG: hypothetical protein Q8R55_07055 [Candidatus Taylorbacteria bacterium]|nr:hypothetical protein [Candidatus Taylorbacteria bacterium]
MGMGRGFNIVFTVIFILMLILFYAVFSEGGQDLSVQESASQWTLLDKIDENEDDLKNTQLKIGKKKYTHIEERIVYNAEGKITSIRKERKTDFEREIALRLLNLDTGVTEIVIVQKRGLLLIAPVGYDVQVVKRRNGIQWNGRNTHLKVLRPSQNIVIKIAWPDEKTKKNFIYSPYSADDPNTPDEIEPGIHTPETVATGTEYARNIFTMACQILHDRGIRSRAFPQYLVCETPFLPLKAYQRLLLIEQMDESEFYLDSRKTAERVLVILGTNPNRAFPTCNSSKPWRACGLMQFTDRWRGKGRPGTYSTVVRAFPEAKLIKTFPAGAFDHINVAIATILLYNLNLDDLVRKFGQKIIEKIIEDPVFTEMVLAAPYNGGLGWTNKALVDYFSGKIEDWTISKHLRKETRGYAVKHRYLIENDLP